MCCVYYHDPTKLTFLHIKMIHLLLMHSIIIIRIVIESFVYRTPVLYRLQNKSCTNLADWACITPSCHLCTTLFTQYNQCSKLKCRLFCLLFFKSRRHLSSILRTIRILCIIETRRGHLGNDSLHFHFLVPLCNIICLIHERAGPEMT